MDTKHVIK